MKLALAILAAALLSGCRLSVQEHVTRYAADGKTPVQHEERHYPGWYEFHPDGSRIPSQAGIAELGATARYAIDRKMVGDVTESAVRVLQAGEGK